MTHHHSHQKQGRPAKHPARPPLPLIRQPIPDFACNECGESFVEGGSLRCPHCGSADVYPLADVEERP